LPLAVTFFQDAGAYRKSEVSTTLLALADRIRNTHATEKAKLPWLKLARFGDLLSHKDSLRHDANMLAITGIEADYDGEVMQLEEASELLLKAGILSLLYTSPSHTKAAPRWRILCPLDEEMPPQERSRYLGRLNGLFRGRFSNESWTLSQAYYFGAVKQNPTHKVELVEGVTIDQHDDLDTAWLGKPVQSSEANGAPGFAGSEAREDAELVRCIVTGEHLHVELCALAARYIGRNVPPPTVEELLRGIMLSHPEGVRDKRWLDRYHSIPDLVASALWKYRADSTQSRRPIAALALRLIRERRPGADVRTAVLAEAEAAGMSTDDAERILQWAARQELKRRGGVNG
jgi:hypothetical protein